MPKAVNYPIGMMKMDAKIFVSHSHSDVAIATHLVDLLLSAMEVSEGQIRCSSVPGHQLPFGRTIPQKLKEDINVSAGVIIIVTQNSLASGWVLFEMGASWALGKMLIPILGPGIEVSDLPGPLSDYPSIQIDSKDASSRLRDALSQMASVLGIAEITGGRPQHKLDQLLAVFKAAPSRAITPKVEQAMAFELSWLIMTVLSGSARHPTAIYERVRGYLSKLNLSIKEPIESYLSADDGGTSVMQLMETIGGQVAVQHRQLVPYFEAGLNLLLDIARNDGKRVIEILKRMKIPSELMEPRENKLQWANEVHNFFEKALI